MKRTWIILSMILLSLCLLVSCGDKNDPPTQTTKAEHSITFSVDGVPTVITVTEGELPVYTGDAPADKTESGKTYRFAGWDKEITPASEDTTYTAVFSRVLTVRWNYANGILATEVLAGEMPIPPSVTTEDSQSVSSVYTFLGWDKTIAPISESEYDAANGMVVFSAQYDYKPRMYDVVYKNGDTVVKTIPTAYNTIPVFDGKLPDKAGYNYIGWTNSTEPIKGETVCEAIYSVYDPLQLDWALNQSEMTYLVGSNDNSGETLDKSCALLFVLTEYANSPKDNPRLSIYRDYITKNLTYMVTEGHTPYFDLEPYWSYCNLTAAIALSHEIPEIWNALSSDVKERYDFVMKCFAYVLALGTADVNDYKTGPGMIGNYSKIWNPNYRLANVTPMIFIAKYFGGAAKVNEILHAFDFSDTVDTFRTYGEPFSRALAQWSAEAPRLSDGSLGPTPEYFMENGGPAYLKARNDSAGDRLGITEGQAAGTGAGVRINYTYLGHTLDEPDKILNELFRYNYSGGRVVNSYGTDTNGKPIAYILNARDEYDKDACSPVIGLPGMMKELGTGDGNGVRSSCTYCTEDFVMICGTLAAADILGMYDIEANENAAVLSLALVGNADFIYKYDTGYMSFSLGKPYVTRAPQLGMYAAWRGWWVDKYGAKTPQGNPDFNKFNPTLYDEDFSGVNVDFKNSNETIESPSGIGFITFQGLSKEGTSKTGATFTSVNSGTNRFLRFALGVGAADPSLNFNYPGGLAAALKNGNADTLTISIALARENGYDVLCGTGMRLRGLGTSDTINLINVSVDGVVRMSNGTVLGTLTEEFQTFTLKICFTTGEYIGYLGETEVDKMQISVPAISSRGSLTEWVKDCTSFIFNWHNSSNGSAKDRSLLIDDLKITVSSSADVQ